MVRWLRGLPLLELPPPDPVVVAASLPPCSVAPLTAVTDAEAAALESQASPVVNRDGLTVRTSRALARFEKIVTARGGAVVITSAYRPEAYQQHLRDVWYKWMTELKDNTEPSCADLKAQIGDEFVRHQLLPTQHPVVVSDHTLGIGFDAAVEFPALVSKRARRRRQVSLDRLARLAGMMRPDVRRDPVHFRLIGARRG
jgi:hypothetical protein